MQTSVGKVLASVFCKVFCSSITLRKKNHKYRILYSIIGVFEEEIASKWLQMKKKCSFTKTMHRVTSRSQRWQNYRNFTSNCFLIHSILQFCTPGDYWLFADLKRMLQGKKFGSNEKVISETEAYFEVKDKLFNKKGIELLEKRCNQCITLEGNYVDELS